MRGRKAVAARVVALGGVVFGTAGCGNVVTTQLRGITGVTADGDGRPVVIIASCGLTYDRVHVTGMQRPGDGGDPERIELTAASPQTGVFTLDLSEPGTGWSGAGGFTPAEPGFLVSTRSSQYDVTTTPVQVSLTAYQQVTGGEVIVRENERWTRAQFDDIACDHTKWPSRPST